MIFAGALTLLAFVSKAQTQKSDWLIGGNLNFDAAKHTTNFGLSPMGGYFFADNFAAGAIISFDYQKVGDFKTTTFGAGPFARYYVGDMTKPFRPFIHTDVSFGSYKEEGSSSVSSTRFYVAPGAAYFLNKNVALEATAGYQNNKVSGSSASSGFALKVGFQIHLTGGDVTELKKRKH